MAVAVGRMSAQEYLATPESRPRHTELIDGTVVVSEPKLPHSRIQGELFYRFRLWIDGGAERGYVSPPADFGVDESNVFAPDLWWVSEGRRPTLDQLDLEGLPDLVVEIRSPSTWARDLGVKLPRYEAAGVPEAWFVDTEARTVLVFRRSQPDAAEFDVALEVGVDHELTSPLLEGFALRVWAIFGD
jgi:Uma2 family endonuclease